MMPSPEGSIFRPYSAQDHECKLCFALRIGEKNSVQKYSQSGVKLTVEDSIRCLSCGDYTFGFTALVAARSALLHSGHRPRPCLHASPVALHSCPFVQVHQIRLAVPATTMVGARSSLRVGCHSAANSGWVVVMQLNPARTFLFEQTAQPVRWRIRRSADTFHSWPDLHCHQNARRAPATTSLGVSSPFDEWFDGIPGFTVEWWQP